MTIKDRILESEQRFEQKKAERQQHLDVADECLIEMTMLQGEWRVLNEMLNSEKKADTKQANKKATVIEAVPDKVK